MKRTLETLIRTVREGIRAEGPDGGGIPDTFVLGALWDAVVNLAEVAPVETVIGFETVEGQNAYSVATVLEKTRLNKVYKVLYGDRWLEYTPRNDFFELTAPTTGSVTAWTLWGDVLTLIGEVEGIVTVTLYVSVTPARMEKPDDTHGLPVYAEAALIHYAMSQCYQVTRDYDRSSIHFNIFRAEKELVARRSAEAQAETTVSVSDPYWGPHRE